MRDRGDHPRPLLAEIDATLEAQIAGGVRAIEISLTSPDAEAQIERAARDG